MSSALKDGDILVSSLPSSGNLLYHEYDPEYARQYYLRTRKLKGRVRRATGSTMKDRGLGKMKEFDKDKGEKYYDRSRKLKTRLDNVTSMEREAEERLIQLKAKLDILRKELRRLVEAAKKRSGGIDPGKGSEKKQAETKSKSESKDSKEKTETKETKDSKDSKGSKDKKPKPLTATQKREKAKADKERYDKANKEAQSAAESIRILETRIKEVQARINAMTKRAREQAAAKSKQTASNGRSQQTGRRQS